MDDGPAPPRPRGGSNGGASDLGTNVVGVGGADTRGVGSRGVGILGTGVGTLGIGVGTLSVGVLGTLVGAGGGFGVGAFRKPGVPAADFFTDEVPPLGEPAGVNDIRSGLLNSSGSCSNLR